MLGIDAAWTATEPSGVALLEACGDGWRCVAAAPGYEAFRLLAGGVPVDWSSKHRGEDPDASAVLAAARRLTTAPIVVAAVDMPMATTPIVGRRAADTAISRAFGARHCGAHSPGAGRPGEIGRRLQAGLEAAGLALATTDTTAGTAPALLEVYPHPALLTLCEAPRRVPYKASKTRTYWPGASPEERRARVLVQLRRIADALQANGVKGVEVPLDEAADGTLRSLKPAEDALDAIVSAWVGTRYLEGRVTAYGDREAAIWVPT